MKHQTTHRWLLPIGVLLLILGGAAPTVDAQFSFTDINPDNSNLDSTDPDGASGGRVNGLATVPGDNTIFYAASEWGGIYKTTNGGSNWFRLDGHNPNATWDVEVNPGNASTVYATSFYDGRDGDSVSGINVSTNSGSTWTRPVTALPPGGTFCSSPDASGEPSAFGIAVDPDDTDNVYIGTNCGLAISTDGGTNWIYRNTKPGFLAWWVIDVVVHDDGIIDICGYWGHQRSTNGGMDFSEPSADLPGGRCSIAASPDEEDVLFVTVGANIYESDDGGVSWTNLGTPDSKRQGRIPFVATNKRSDDAFDLWYGDIRLYRGGCTSNVDGLRCPAGRDDPDSPAPAGWNGPFTRSVGGHDDVGDIVFNVTAADNACPEILSCDGGVYYNSDTTSPGCHDPNWEEPTVTPHGLWLWTLNGVDKPGDAVDEHLYFGLQDNGPYGTTDAGAVQPVWNNAVCCDGFDTAADADQVLFTDCCFGGRATRMWHGTPGMGAGFTDVNTYPADGLFPGFRFPDIVDTFGAGKFVAVTVDCGYEDGVDNDGDGDVDEDDEVQGGCSGSNMGDGGIYITTGASIGSVSWTEIGPGSEPPTGGDDKVCAVQAAVDGGTPTFYVQVGRCSGVSNDELWKFVGTDPGGTWAQVNLPPGDISIFAVDPNDPDRLFAANNRIGNTPAMVLSDDGGATWEPLPELDDLMTGGGDFKYRVKMDPWGNPGFSQPTLVAFDEEDPNILAAGAWHAGVFLSTDGGEDWVLVTDPDSTSSTPPNLPQPRFAYFDHDESGGTEIDMYVGTRGRGVWRVTFQQPPVADANGPYETNEGTNVALDGGGSTNAGGGVLTYEWDFDDDGMFDDATGETPDFDPVGDGVGQDGVYTVRLKVTNEDGLSDTDESTVTVNNVAPSVSFDPQDPEDEGDPLIVTGTISDPGWLDILTATIKWGDGTAAEDIVVVLENVRPDATLTFEVSHCYGDNGIYPVQVCGFDDDTSTCKTMDVSILNVAPVVAIDAGQVIEINEGEFVNVLANFEDQGWLDTYGSTIDWGYVLWPPEAGTLDVTTQGSDCDDPDVGTVSGSRQYGDNDDGTGFTITVSVTDDDGGTGMDDFSLTVNNIDPTAEIDETAAVDVCGVPTFIAHAGEDVDFSGRSTDPGSDDLFLGWDWDDGPPSPDVTTDYLVNNPVPGPDPLPSPEVDPRDVIDMKTHAFADACYYNVMFLADDDDDGHGEDDTDVVIVGNAELIRSAGYWFKNYRRVGHHFFTDEELLCFLDIVNHTSTVFSEETDADSLDDAEELLHPSHSNGEIRVQFDRQLLAVWLNFANGAIEHDELVDTDFDPVPDTELLTFLCAAEAARLNPATTDPELEELKDLLEAINLLDR
jgi:hypothetical protein